MSFVLRTDARFLAMTNEKCQMEKWKIFQAPFTMSSVYTEGGLAPALPQSLNQFFKSPPASEPGRW
jgi:hypothetical protein